MLTLLLLANFVSATLSSNLNHLTLFDTTATLQAGETTELTIKSLEYVYTFFRHGIRSPLNNPYPKDPYKDKYQEYFEGQLGELTRIGKQQMYKVGKKLYNIYGNFVGGFSEEKVHVSSTETSRTIMSALSVMAGLFPPKKPLFRGLNWQPIPVWQDTRDFDKVYFYNDDDFPKLAIQQCPRWGLMIQNGYDIVKEKDSTNSRDEIYRLIREGTGNSEIDSIDSAYKIYDTLEFENFNELPPPRWATNPQPSYNNKPLFPNLMRPLQVEWFLDCQWLDKNQEMLSFYSGPLFNSINVQFADKTERKKENKELFRYHNTHDDTIYTLRWTLGFDDPSFEVQPGDGIAFELHKQKVENEDKYFVQVVYYHSTEEDSKFREVLQLPDCPSPCPKDKFTAMYPGMTPQAWEEMCKE